MADQLVDNGQDSDGDGLSDCVETRGMLTGLGLYGASNAGAGPSRYIRTVIDDPDTDHDGLSDGAEMGNEVDMSSSPGLIFAYPFLHAAGIDRVWSPKSDPTQPDSDDEWLLDADEVINRTLAFDVDTDNDTSTDYEEVRSSGTDPLIPDEFVDHRIPGIKPDTLLVPQSFYGDIDRWMPSRLQSLMSVYDPETGQCISGDDGCAAIHDYVQGIWGSGDRFDHNKWCLYVTQSCHIDDNERAVIEEIVEAQAWWDGKGAIRDDRLQLILRRECALSADEPSECTDRFISSVVERISENPKSWDEVLQTVFLLLEWIPGGRRPPNLENHIQQKVTKLDRYIRQALKEEGPKRADESATAYGTRIHTKLAALIKNLGDPDISADISYLNREVVPYGTTGSLRPDVVLGPREEPWAILDFKTGITGIRNGWGTALREQHLPADYSEIPILQWFV